MTRPDRSLYQLVVQRCPSITCATVKNDSNQYLAFWGGKHRDGVCTTLALTISFVAVPFAYKQVAIPPVLACERPLILLKRPGRSELSWRLRSSSEYRRSIANRASVLTKSTELANVWVLFPVARSFSAPSVLEWERKLSFHSLNVVGMIQSREKPKFGRCTPSQSKIRCEKV